MYDNSLQLTCRKRNNSTVEAYYIYIGYIILYIILDKEQYFGYSNDLKKNSWKYN